MEENKYYHDFDKLIDKEEENRARRRKSRVRSRILAWVVLISVVVLAFCGGYFLFSKLLFGQGFKLPERKASKEPEASVTTGEIVDNLSSGEEKIKVDPADLKQDAPTEEDLYTEALTAYLDTIPIEDKVAGLFMVTPEQLTGAKTVQQAGQGTKEAFDKYAVGGNVFSDKNIAGADKFKTMISNTQDYSRYPLFLAISEESGRGTLAGKLKLTSTLREDKVGESGDPQVASEQAVTIANYLKEYGINCNLGIVADVLTNAESKFEKERTFGSDPALCASMTSAMTQAYSQAGIITALKAFPGEGEVTENTDGLVTVERSVDEMRSCEFTSFLAGIEAGADMLVVSHIYAPNLTGDNEQCSRSKTLMTDLLRIEYGLDDVIIVTDALNKAAIAEYYDSAEASITSLKAGADMVMMPENFPDAYAGVLQAVYDGVISTERVDASLMRIYRVKFKGMSIAEINELTNSVKANMASPDKEK